MLKQLATFQNGQMTVTDLGGRRTSGPITRSRHHRPLVDTLTLKLGHMELGPQQAKDMMLRGEISDQTLPRHGLRGPCTLRLPLVFSVTASAHEEPHDEVADAEDFTNLTEDDVELADENEQDDDEDLTPEEKAERKAEKLHQQFVENADEALNRWHETQPVETRELVVGNYIATGDLDHAVAGVDELELAVVHAAFTGHVERNVLKPVGLTMDQWSEHIDEADLPAFRQAVVRGDWLLLIEHARAAANMRLDLGL